MSQFLYRNLFYMILLVNMSSDLLYLRYERQSRLSEAKELQERLKLSTETVWQPVQACPEDRLEHQPALYDASQRGLYDLYYSSTPVRYSPDYRFLQYAPKEYFLSNLKDSIYSRELKKQKAVVKPRITAF